MCCGRWEFPLRKLCIIDMHRGCDEANFLPKQDNRKLFGLEETDGVKGGGGGGGGLPAARRERGGRKREWNRRMKVGNCEKSEEMVFVLFTRTSESAFTSLSRSFSLQLFLVVHKRDSGIFE